MTHPTISFRFALLPLVSLTALLAGCGTTSRDPVSKSAALYQAASCPDLLGQIQADAIAKLDLQLEQYRQYARDSGGVTGNSGTGGTTSSTDGGDFASDDGSAAPEAPVTGGESEGDSGGKSDQHSETNTQVAGVDEADVVKTDGERIYLLHGDRLSLFDAWPADETHELGSVAVPGAFELFVEGSKATVFSSVYPTDVPAAAGGGAGQPKPGFDCYDCYYGGATFTQISVFDVSGDAPVLEREMLFEGSYVSARRHGSAVRAIVQGGFLGSNIYYPDVSYYDTFGRQKTQAAIDQELQQWRDRVAGEIGTTTLDNWIPRRFERIDGRLVALPLECESYFVPEPGLVQDGVTQVVTFDIEQPAQAPHALAVLGGAGTVYANLDTMVLGQTDYGWNYHEVQSTRTLLHRFSLAEAETNYEASGFVPGYLHNQFSIDEAEGVIRVSTTEDRVTDPLSWSTTTENRVYTLGADGRDLEVLGKTDAFGEPGETIFATRFLGDRGYVVTFRQTDPLVAVDLSDAAHPKVLGELHIPGFSDYIHPLPNHHLLTIGQDADENGSQSGVALQIFDVTDAAAPRQVHKETFGGFSYSEASYNHKAFSFVDGHFGEGRGLLMFPITTYDPEYSSRLEVLEVSASAGFTRIGSIDHTKLLHDGCGSLLQNGAGVEYCYYGGNDMRRGLEIGQSDGADFVYAISYGGITVHDLADLSTTLKTVPLPAPTYTDYYSYGAPEVDPAPDAGAGGSAP